MAAHLGISDADLEEAVRAGRVKLADPAKLEDDVAAALSDRARELEERCGGTPQPRRMGADRILTHPVWGLPAMGLLLAGALWLTITGANVPSAWLSRVLFALGERLEALCAFLPAGMRSALFDGMWRTAAAVTAVMLPPMAIFFPLFTLLEDVGYLPRVAFNLDGCFQRAHGSGKQALTM